MRWIYEPSQFKTIYGYIPDFIIYEGDEMFLADWLYVVEYKPSVPNIQYLNYLSSQFEEIKRRDCYDFIDNFYLIFGNCFNGGFFRIMYDFDKHQFSEQIEPVPWISEIMINRAKTHRYDLEQTF